jgi:arsenate reductase
MFGSIRKTATSTSELKKSALRSSLSGMKLKSQAPQQETDNDSSLPLILILCTANSCRSQLAEGVLKATAADFLEVASAGSHPAGYVHPLAIRVMGEIGIDISDQYSKSISEFLFKHVETVITVCGNSDGACPAFPGDVRRHHWPFDDPAKAEGTTEEKLKVFRLVRDQMRHVFEAYAAGRKDGFRGLQE